MESMTPAEQLRVIERSEAAPWISFPPTPWWCFPAVGACAAAVVGTFAWWRVNAGLFAGALALLVALEVLLVAWQKRRYGALPVPGYGRPPAEIAAMWRAYVAGMAVVVGVVALAWWLGGIAAGAAVAFAAGTAGIALYDRRYARASARVRARLQ